MKWRIPGVLIQLIPLYSQSWLCIYTSDYPYWWLHDAIQGDTTDMPVRSNIPLGCDRCCGTTQHESAGHGMLKRNRPFAVAVTLAPATPSPSQCNYVFLLISCQTCNQRRNGNLITSLSLSPNYLRDILNNLFLQNCSVKLLWWAVLGSTLPLRYIYLDSLGLLKSPNVMTVVVLMDLEPGPYEHDLPFDYPNFDNLELNSGIYLMSVFISILFL